MWFYFFLIICIIILSIYIKRNPDGFKLDDRVKLDDSDCIEINPGSGLPMTGADIDSDGNTCGRGDWE